MLLTMLPIPDKIIVFSIGALILIGLISIMIINGYAIKRLVKLMSDDPIHASKTPANPKMIAPEVHNQTTLPKKKHIYLSALVIGGLGGIAVGLVFNQCQSSLPTPQLQPTPPSIEGGGPTGPTGK